MPGGWGWSGAEAPVGAWGEVSAMRGFEGLITFCPVADLGATARFYEDDLGLDLALDQGSCRIYRVRDGAYLGFCRSETARPAEGVILTLVTDDVDGWHERLMARGVPVEAPPRLNPDYLVYHFFARDPTGHRVEIQRFEDRRWAGGGRRPDRGHDGKTASNE
jgi:catechol 2,3-dioxygenase-like lactoylglutathione lyase family enzyme